jgi:hypothetical protein
MTDLVKIKQGLVWRNGNTHQLIRDCENVEMLRKVFSESLYRAMNLYHDTDIESVKIIVGNLLDDCDYDPIDVLGHIVTQLTTGKRKIYGKVTPNDIQELLIEAREKEAIKKEKNLHDQKQINKDNDNFDREEFYKKGVEYLNNQKENQKKGFNVRHYEEKKREYFENRE